MRRAGSIWLVATIVVSCFVGFVGLVCADSGRVLFKEDFSQDAVGWFPMAQFWTPNRGDVLDVFRVVSDPEMSPSNLLQIVSDSQGTEGYLLSPPIEVEGPRLQIAYSTKLELKEGKVGETGFYLFPEGAAFPPHLTLFLSDQGVRSFGTVDGKLVGETVVEDLPADSFVDIVMTVDLEAGTVQYAVGGNGVERLFPLRRSGWGEVVHIALFWRPGNTDAYYRYFEVRQLD